MNCKFSLAIVSVCLSLFGCTPSITHPSNPANLNVESSEGEDGPYRIGAGDEVEIKFFLATELNETVQVGPDGKISLMFAHNIQAAGKTPEELGDLIKKKIASHVKEPDLVVIMHSFGSQKVYVGGEVAKPGPVQLTGHETVLQVINDAGWVTPLAQTDEVVLVRKSADGEQGIYPLHIGKVMSGEDASQNVTVQAGDLILVPPSGAVKFDRWVDQHIRQALPFSTSASAVYTNQNLGASR